MARSVLTALRMLCCSLPYFFHRTAIWSAYTTSLASAAGRRLPALHALIALACCNARSDCPCPARSRRSRLRSLKRCHVSMLNCMVFLFLGPVIGKCLCSLFCISCSSIVACVVGSVDQSMLGHAEKKSCHCCSVACAILFLSKPMGFFPLGGLQSSPSIVIHSAKWSMPPTPECMWWSTQVLIAIELQPMVPSLDVRVVESRPGECLQKWMAQRDCAAA